MATNRDMLAEAIADAKAVKNMAIANAKAALEEAFTPQLKSMLSLKLQEMADEEIAEDTIEETYDEVEEGFGEFDTPENTGFGEMGKKALDEEDIDLDELLAEIENEEEIDETLNEAEEAGESEEEEAGEEEEEEGEPMDLEDMTDEDLKAMIADVIADMVEAGELEAGHEEGEEEEGEDIDMEMDDTDEEDVDLAELLREIEEDTVTETTATTTTETTVDTTALTTELENAYATIDTLRSELNEINLLNAKLLYTNKIFKAKTLNEEQKVKVLSSFDKATTVKEVKLVYSTLNEGLKVKTTPIRENLGRASKATNTPVVNTKQPIVESNAVFDRMRKLAGLI